MPRRLLATLSLLSMLVLLTLTLRADDRSIVARYQHGTVLTALLYLPPFLLIRPNTFYGGAILHLGWLLVPSAAYVALYARKKYSGFLGTPLLILCALFFLIISLSWMPYLDSGEFTPRFAPVIAFAGPTVWRHLRRIGHFLRLRSARRRVASLARGICPNCGYDLRATPTHCPECGASFPSPTQAHLPPTRQNQAS